MQRPLVAKRKLASVFDDKSVQTTNRLRPDSAHFGHFFHEVNLKMLLK